MDNSKARPDHARADVVQHNNARDPEFGMPIDLGVAADDQGNLRIGDELSLSVYGRELEDSAPAS